MLAWQGGGIDCYMVGRGGWLHEREGDSCMTGRGDCCMTGRGMVACGEGGGWLHDREGRLLHDREGDGCMWGGRGVVA